MVRKGSRGPGQKSEKSGSPPERFPHEVRGTLLSRPSAEVYEFRTGLDFGLNLHDVTSFLVL